MDGILEVGQEGARIEAAERGHEIENEPAHNADDESSSCDLWGFGGKASLVEVGFGECGHGDEVPDEDSACGLSAGGLKV